MPEQCGEIPSRTRRVHADRNNHPYWEGAPRPRALSGVWSVGACEAGRTVASLDIESGVTATSRLVGLSDELADWDKGAFADGFEGWKAYEVAGFGEGVVANLGDVTGRPFVARFGRCLYSIRTEQNSHRKMSSPRIGN